MTKLIIIDPEFFTTPPKKLVVEDNTGTGRTYILKAGRIVAVGVPTQEQR